MKNINFMGKMRLFNLISLTLFIISLFLISTKGFNLSIDFTGGTEIIVENSKNETETKLKSLGIDNYTINEKQGNKIAIKTYEINPNSDLSENISKELKVISLQSFGSSVSEETTYNTILAISLALFIIILYASFRFEFKFALGSVVAIIHDIFIVAGIFSLFSIKIDLATFAAFLAIIGYSINDTIVIFDRIKEETRENLELPMKEIVNNAINNSLSRTLITSGTTLLSLISVLLFGGDSLFGFSLALTIGVVIGTLSSIYVAPNIVIYKGLSKEKIKELNDEEKITT